MTLSLEQLRNATINDAAIRRRQRLQPVGGPGDKIFPPTFPGEGRNPQPGHVYERRRLNGDARWCVLVDSPQSQANRLEESLLGALRDGRLELPYVVVDFARADLAGLTSITSLEAPHRVYDAIFRDSEYNGQPFMESEVGQRLAKAKPEDASALLEISPTALLFGAWHSTGEGGGLGAKFARALVSEIVAVDVPVEEVLVDQRTGETDVRTSGRRTGSRIDPLGVLRKVKVFKGQNGWDVSKEKAGKGAKEVKPSEINHGNIRPSVQPLGITCDYLDHTFVLSFAALRRLRFGTEERSTAARTMLAALALVALHEQDARGYALRSRCDLVCDGSAPLELIHPDGAAEAIALTRDDALALYREARNAAAAAGFTFPAHPLKLMPQSKLVEIVRQSQQLALAGEGGTAGDEADA